jgi:hypothetical protein
MEPGGADDRDLIPSGGRRTPIIDLPDDRRIIRSVDL